MSNTMGMFEEQIRNRNKFDSKEMSRAMVDVADSLKGEEHYHPDEKSNANVRHEVETICQFYQVEIPSDTPNTTDVNELIDYITQPSGIMRRRVLLEDKWYKDGDGALLAVRKEDGRLFALLPGKVSGYSYIDESGKQIRINKKNKDIFETEAVCFYRPLPSKKLSKLDFIGFLLKNTSISDYVLVLGITLLCTLLGMVMPAATSMIFKNIIPTGKLLLVITIALFLVTTSVASYFISAVKMGLLDRIRGRIDVLMENSVMNRVMHMPTNFFHGKSAGGLSESMISLKVLPDILTNAILGPGITAIFSLAYIVQIAIIAPSLAIPAFITLIGQGLVIFLSIKQKMKVTRKELEADIETQGIAYALITGIQRIKLSGSENRVLGRWLKKYKNKSEAAYHMRIPSAIQNELVAFVALLGTLWVYFSGASSGLEIAQFAAFLSAFGLATKNLAGMAQTGEALAYLKPVLDMIEPILESIPETSSGKANAKKLRGSIEMNHVSFRYTPDGPLIVDDLSLKIRPGEYIAIVGKSGCGKSTLMRLLMGFEKPESGAIIFDNNNIDNLDPASVRRNIGTVLQNGKLFAGDIYSNITISAPWLTLKDAWEAAEMAGVADAIKEMPMGMNTLISEGSGGISGGQKQRLMIARAIAPKPRILMFDEATSALDNITQKTVSDSLEKLHCTRIVIAHRLSTIKNCDRIIVLDNGKIIEDGTYNELVAKNGFFAELVARQQA